jgi:hypothetical protein
VLDVAAVLDAWSACPTDYCASDFNGDGFVNATDLAFVLTGWDRCV